MRHTGLLAFGITTAVLVPAALHQLDAGSAQVARLAAPGARSLALGGATIDVAADRAIVDAGGTVSVTLTAREAAAQKVTAAVVVLESRGSDGGRVETPPRPIARELVTFTPGKAGEQHRLSFTLRGYRGLEMDGRSPFGHYSILVMAPEAATRLERLRKRAARVDNPMEDEGGRYGAWSTAYYALDQRDDADDEQAAAGDVGSDDAALEGDGGDDEGDDVVSVIGPRGATARLDVYTRSTGGPVALTVPDRAQVGTPYQVTVKVTNQGKHRVSGVGVSLQRPPLYGVEYRGLADEQVTIEPASAILDLGPRETRTVSFTVTASAAGTAGLYAWTSCDQAEDWTACNGLLDGALDATDIVAPEPAAAGTVAVNAR